jgi:organic hydroperoxide reductase OsmC/OhrA
MEVSARVRNRPDAHEVRLSTAGAQHILAVSAKTNDAGSAVNGGELLKAAQATCYSNNL